MNFLKTHKRGNVFFAISLFFVMVFGGTMLGEISFPGSGKGEADIVCAAAVSNGKTDSMRSLTLAQGEEVRGAWVSFLDYQSAGLYRKSEATFEKNADAMFEKLAEDKINTVFFHVVPCNDAIYPSEYLRWSSYMFRSAPSYDPLEILIEKAHAHNISFHAWVNPYRQTMSRIFDPGKASSKKRVVRIVKEIIQNYDVDGIHFDDYFYPSKSKGKQLYSVSVSKRKQVINTMVKKIYKVVKKYDSTLLFGISPAGNVDYAKSIGCDLNAWLSQDGYVDYIIPQIYWSDNYMVGGKSTKMYTNRLNLWASMNKNNTPMYIGLALYRAGWYNSIDRGWSSKSTNIVEQIQLERAKGCDGFVFFSSQDMSSTRGSREMSNYRDYIK